MRIRPVTIKDIARRLGISYSTVSRALSSHRSHLVKEQTRILVEQTADEMDYSPNLMARTFVKSTGGVLGLLTNRIVPEITGRQINHLVRVAGRHGYQVLVASAAGRTAIDVESERVEQLMQLTSRDVDGILIQTIGDEAESARIVHATPDELPVSTFGYAVDVMTDVSLDLAKGIRAVTEHLIGLGHERICFLGEDGIRADRLPVLGAGYRSAMRKHGLTPRLAPVEAARIRSGYRLGKELIRRYTALVCCCDYTALGVCRALIESGVRVPDDVAVTGCGDFEVSAYVSPSLTTLSIPFEAIAHTAVEGILRQLQGRSALRRRSFKPHLTVRESCGARQDPPV